MPNSTAGQNGGNGRNAGANGSIHITASGVPLQWSAGTAFPLLSPGGVTSVFQRGHPRHSFGANE